MRPGACRSQNPLGLPHCSPAAASGSRDGKWLDAQVTGKPLQQVRAATGRSAHRMAVDNR